jgi:hypothetical protein
VAAREAAEKVAETEVGARVVAKAVEGTVVAVKGAVGGRRW